MPSTGPADDVDDAPAAGASQGRGVPTAVTLAPEPGAAATAREWMSAVLDGWPARSVDAARLLVSELVTNAVLHARSEIGLRCHFEATHVRIEIADGRRDGPLLKRYARDSSTGRGLRLVSALATEWGVTRGPAGKVVWFIVTPETGAGASLEVQAQHDAVAAFRFARPRAAAVPEPPQPAAAVPTDDAVALASGAPEGGALETVTVEILGIPLDMYLEAEEHNDAVVRELTLVLQASTTERGMEVPARLLEVAAEVRAMFASASTSMRAQVERAFHQRQETLDIIVQVPLQAWDALQRLASQLDELDRFCDSGHLLTVGSSPRLRRFRQWYTRQVGDQLRGLPATPWPGTADGVEH